MDEQGKTGSSESRPDRKFVILEIEEEAPDFSGGRENIGGFSDVQMETASDDPIFGFEITEDFWQREETRQVDAVPDEAPKKSEEIQEQAEVPAEDENHTEEESIESVPPIETKPHDPFYDFRLETQPAFLFDVAQSSEEKAECIPSKEPQKPGSRVLRSVASWTLTVIVAFALALLINIFVFRPSEVSGDSMVPTLHNTDMVVLSRIPYVFGEPERGDIVVIDSHVNEKRGPFALFGEALKYNVITKLCGQEEPDYFWIKRVVGTAGDEISFSENQIYRNGELLEEDYLNESFIYTYPNGLSLTVPEGYVYVMGDNRNHSTDSRVIGPVPLENIIGKMIASW